MKKIEIRAIIRFLKSRNIDAKELNDTYAANNVIIVNRDSMVELISKNNVGIDEEDCYKKVIEILKQRFNKRFYWSNKTDDDLFLDVIEKQGKIMKNVKRIARKILAQQYGIPLMMRGKPNDFNNESQGMDESTQKMYDGKDRSHVTYDQVGLFNKCKNKKKICDWIDEETLLQDIERVSKKSYLDQSYSENLHGSSPGVPGQRSYPFSDEDALEYYYKNPKGKGDAIPVSTFLGIDKPAERIIQDIPLGTTEIQEVLPLLKDKVRENRDNLDQYPTTDQPLYRDKYWKDKSDNLNRGPS
jgi:hypothetical protein